MVTFHYDTGIRPLLVPALVIDDFGNTIEILPLDVPRWLLNWKPIFAAHDFLDCGEVH